MGLFNRVKYIFGSKVEKRLNSLENPKEMLDYSIVQIEKSMRDITKNALDIGVAKKRLEIQKDYHLANSQKHEDSAAQAVTANNEDLAKEALIKKREDEEQVQILQIQIDSLNRSLGVIVKSKKELNDKIELYRAKKEELKAVYDAAKAQIKIKEIMTTLGEDSKNIYEIVERAENKIKNVEAKVFALEELSKTGIIDEIQLLSKGKINSHISESEASKTIEEELAGLKENLSKG
ncbi:MAG: PspA/IM30 family protein [Peptococcaceae bacterium]